MRQLCQILFLQSIHLVIATIMPLSNRAPALKRRSVTYGRSASATCSERPRSVPPRTPPLRKSPRLAETPPPRTSARLASPTPTPTKTKYKDMDKALDNASSVSGRLDKLRREHGPNRQDMEEKAAEQAFDSLAEDVSKGNRAERDKLYSRFKRTIQNPRDNATQFIAKRLGESVLKQVQGTANLNVQVVFQRCRRLQTHGCKVALEQ